MQVEYINSSRSAPVDPMTVFLSNSQETAVYLTNLPTLSGEGSGLIGLTPSIKALIEDIMPLLGYLLERNNLNCGLPIYLFYANPKEPISSNAEKLLALHEKLAGVDCICLPISNCHSLMIHVFNAVIMELRMLNTTSTRLIYIGDNANKRAMSKVAQESGMPFYFHALY